MAPVAGWASVNDGAKDCAEGEACWIQAAMPSRVQGAVPAWRALVATGRLSPLRAEQAVDSRVASFGVANGSESRPVSANPGAPATRGDAQPVPRRPGPHPQQYFEAGGLVLIDN